MRYRASCELDIEAAGPDVEVYLRGMIGARLADLGAARVELIELRLEEVEDEQGIPHADQ